MKPSNQVTALILDYGTLGISLAEKLSATYAKVFFHSPIDEEFRNVKDCCKGTGIDGIVRVDDYMTPEVFDAVDLLIVPDIGWGGTARFFRQSGKAVWGSMGADIFELSRTKWLETLKSLGLPTGEYEVIKGLTNLDLYLRDVKDRWIKVNRFRANMETWHHEDYDHSIPILDGLRAEFGGLKEQVVFVVQTPIPSEYEIGFDGWTVDGRYPKSGFSGFEKKNELYIGKVMDYDDQPQEIKDVNDKLSAIFKEYQYRNFMATEIRVNEDGPHCIDPTFRQPGQTGEQLLETCSNIADVIWHGANGELIDPEFVCSHVAEATLHYTAGEDDWRVLKLPDETRRFFKLYHYCYLDGVYHFPPAKNDELGVVLGLGSSTEEAIEHLNENLESIEKEPVETHQEGFDELVEAMEK